MSDGFDKEAEREKLREKLAEDEQKREHTQRMSELLLQGATMTNRHCDDCGDPIFRHDGQEFCPTCQATGSGGGTQGDDAQPADADAKRPPQGDGRDTSTAPGGGETAPSTASQDATAQSGTNANAASANAASANAANANAANANAANAVPEPPNAAPSPASNAEQSGEPPASGPPAAPAAPAAPAEPGTVADARASLTRTLARFARAAEETDDPRRARDHLRAAREAAEALAALD
ncbi:Sjogren's syndrome/scleroderma autoantigen 1 family protein [Halorubrum kocurii]|uniref:Sjogrens syndrome scleroderma autoantigen 1 n=1 Tax=Halorubrum kocurii JCM 14978 TaxID=1230456 RepID=M0P8S9_9EURY|nr:Sjogren's syndrome/scleroderma autoantigen 1 family protein [Halorubrum kocurii]EMA66263.1 hypothetical protein C468_04629 [Halorubrum kocurii JCM 14978]